jgi:hypothetical protein
MAQLHYDAYMIILYASFLMDIKGGYQSGLHELAAAKKIDMSLLEKFALFSREQQQTQKSSLKGGQGADLVAYVEMQRNFRMARRINRESFEATKDFWTSLMHSNVQLSTLTSKVARLDDCINQATVIYK